LKPGEAAVEVARLPFHDGRDWTGEFFSVALIVTPETTGNPVTVALGEASDVEGGPFVWKPLENALVQTKRI
jgi:hypothetical protein